PAGALPAGRAPGGTAPGKRLPEIGEAQKARSLCRIRCVRKTMAAYDVALFRERGYDLLVVIVSPAFEQKSLKEKAEAQRVLQECATAAGLIGRVVPVWDGGLRGVRFLASQRWHPFFRGLELAA